MGSGNTFSILILLGLLALFIQSGIVVPLNTDDIDN
jgi:hypothetical protein